jgi:hypothetical protein
VKMRPVRFPGAEEVVHRSGAVADLDLEVQVELAQCFELDRERLLVPLRQLAQAVVGDPKGANLGLAQVMTADRGTMAGPSRRAASRRA